VYNISAVGGFHHLQGFIVSNRRFSSSLGYHLEVEDSIKKNIYQLEVKVEIMLLLGNKNSEMV
jgi:hypothetical protein